MKLIDESHFAAPHRGSLAIIHPRAITSVDDDMSAIGLRQQSGDMEQRLLACARLTNKSNRFSRHQPRRCTVENMDLTWSLPERAPQFDQLQYRMGSRIGRVHVSPHSYRKASTGSSFEARHDG